MHLETKRWVLGLHKASMLNLLQIPHFGRNLINDICVWKLLALVHGDALWLGARIPIDATMIHRIIDLPAKGTDPIIHFGRKAKEKYVAKQIKNKYQVSWKSQGFVVSEINDPIVHFDMLS